MPRKALKAKLKAKPIAKLRRKPQPQHVQHPLIIEIKRLIKPYIASLKPTLTALVFLLVSSFVQQLLDKIQLNKPCVPAQTESTQTYINNSFSRFTGLTVLAVTSIESRSLELEGEVVLAGSRSLTITRHAAERMIERGVSTEAISAALQTGKLFAYLHANKIVKIGYYHTLTKLFVAVNQQHTKILTVIHNVPVKYISRLINFATHVNIGSKIIKPLSMNGLPNLFLDERFVVYLMMWGEVFIVVLITKPDLRINSVKL